MKQGVKFIILTAVLVILIVLAVLGYNYLTSRYSPEESENQGEQTESGLTDQETEPQKNTASDFTVQDIFGEKIKLSDSFGKPMIVNFWATWCGPCKSELPAFESMNEKYGGDVEFLMVNMTDGHRETVSSVKKFISDGEYSFPVYFDTEYEAANAYRVYSIPLTVLIDENGNIYKTHRGAMSENMLEKYITDLIGGNSE